MTHWVNICKRLLYPGKLLTVAIPIAGFGSLAAVFYTGCTESPLAYLSYVMAFYGLMLWILRSVPLLRAAFRYYKKQKEERPLHMRKSLLLSMSINVCYGLFHLVSGVRCQSIWLISTGAYYLGLSLIRLVLVFYEKRQMGAEDMAQQLAVGWKGFQVCGRLLLLLNLTISGKVFQMIWHGQVSHYPEYVVYAVATYTFYRLISSVLQVLRRKDSEAPVKGAASNINLTAAMMSLYSLQTVLLDVFGDDPDFQFLMNSLTGSAVCLLVTFGALGMMMHGAIKQRQTGKTE